MILVLVDHPTRLVYSDGEDRIQIKGVGLDSEAKKGIGGPDFMRGTVPGTTRGFWAGLLVYAFTLVYGFLIDRPN